jgi:acyl transferase domain-containing protein
MADGLEIAIIGMAGKFPNALSMDEFWKNLCDGVESISVFSEEELLAEGVSADVLRDSNYVRAKAVLKDVDCFDARFFGFSPGEAEITDPQQRIFLECAWEALEHAGYDVDSIDLLVSVYAAQSLGTYLFALQSDPAVRKTTSEYQLMLGNDKDFLATRVSYKLNLKGPSVCVQTACSSSLVTVSMACQSLITGESDMALAGAVSVGFPHKVGHYYQRDGIGSPDGHCRPFDAHANGTVRGEAVGIVVLKRLKDAVADRDTIHAVIRGTAVNNDGAQKAGYTALGVHGPAAAIRAALIAADTSPDSIGYVEAHAIGTLLGDAIEFSALKEAFGDNDGRKQFCAIGSAKSNVGHADVAAGIVGLIKTVLVLKHHQIPPVLHFTKANPAIDLEDSPFYVNGTLRPWPILAGAPPRRAGVSSFGVGGTNAHIIVEEAMPAQVSGESRHWQLLLFSAPTEKALERNIANFLRFLKAQSSPNLPDIAFTLKVGRKAFPHRRVVLCRNLAEAIEALEGHSAARTWSGIAGGESPSIAFVFPDELEDQLQIARELYETEELFHRTFDDCASIVRSELHLDICKALYGTVSNLHADGRWIECVRFCVQYGLARLWMSWDVRPEAMLGYGPGEYVAACLAGDFSPDHALRVIASQFCHENARVLASEMRDTERNHPRISNISTRLGCWVSELELGGQSHWRRDPEDVTRLPEGMAQLCRGKRRTILEIGRGTSIASIPPGSQAATTALTTLYSHRAAAGDQPAVLEALGRLWLKGTAIDWTNFYSDEQRKRVPLPTYSFERERYRIQSTASAATENFSDHSADDENKASHSRPILEQPYEPPVGEIETSIATIWRELLGISEIGRCDNFFQLGGTSLLAVQVVTRMRGQISHGIALKTFFDAPTISGLAEALVGSSVAGGAARLQNIPCR